MANSTRLKIVELLMQKPLCVGEICEKLGEEQSKISHSLKCLTDCHFLDARQDGKKRIYTLNKDTILPLMRLVDMHVKKYCCDGCRMNNKNNNK